MDISGAIRLVRQRYLAEGLATSHFAINNGLCDQLAADVLALLGPDAKAFSDYGGENFMTGLDGDPYESDVWDWELLAKAWNIQPPAGLSSSDVDALGFGGHVWLSDGKLHYDAECPEGVSSFFDLPLYRRYFVEALRMKGISTPEVETDDIVVAPRCPVPNPAPALS